MCNFWKVLRVPSGDICISRVSFERQVTPKAVRSCSVHTHDWPWAKRKASPVPWPESRGRRGRAGTAAGCGVAHSRRSGARQTPAPSTLPTTLSGGKTYLPLLRTRTRHDPPSSPLQKPAALGHKSRRSGSRTCADHGSTPPLGEPVREAGRREPSGQAPTRSPRRTGLAPAGPARPGSTARPAPGPSAAPRPRPPYLGVLLARGPVLLPFGGLSSLRWLLCGRPCLLRALGLRLHLRLNDDDLCDAEEG